MACSSLVWPIRSYMWNLWGRPVNGAYCCTSHKCSVRPFEGELRALCSFNVKEKKLVLNCFCFVVWHVVLLRVRCCGAIVESLWGCASSAVMFKWAVCVKVPHECQDPNFASWTLHCDKMICYLLLLLIVIYNITACYNLQRKRFTTHCFFVSEYPFFRWQANDDGENLQVRGETSFDPAIKWIIKDIHLARNTPVCRFDLIF